MKKLFTTLAVVAGLAFTANSQEFKPKAGSVTTEFGLTGGINNTSFDSKETDGLLRFRYFAKQDLAYRIGFAAGINQNTDKVYEAAPGTGEGSLKTSTNSLYINLGVEKHFAGTDRLSPYVGADIVFGTEKSTRKAENYAAGAYVNGTNSETKGPGELSIGLRGVVGADYYIAKNLFLGAEAGLGFNYAKEGKTESTVGGTTIETESAGNRFDLGTSFVSAVRIGFVF